VYGEEIGSAENCIEEPHWQTMENQSINIIE
jgi:hypothetical protein